MDIAETSLPGILLLRPTRHGDARGFFSETFKASALAAHGVSHVWAQDNHSFSADRGVVRGLHFQRPPHAQAKLVRVIRGAILDVVVDLRRGSPHYGRSLATELSADNWAQLYVPAGFAHGLCTLTENTEVLYKVDVEYTPAAEDGVIWNDPDLDIAWPVATDAAILSPRDKTWPRFPDFTSPF